MDKYLYYCENCDKLFKLSNKGKKVKCTRCGSKLKDLEITSTDYEALSPDEKEVLKMWTVVEDTQDDAGTDAISRGADKIDEKNEQPDQSAAMFGLETESSEPDTLFAGSGSSLFSSIMSEKDSEPKAEPMQDTAADDGYGQDDTGLDSGSDFDGDLDFFFENQDEGIRTPGISSDKGSGEGAPSSNEKKLDSGSDYGMDDDFGALFDVGDDDDYSEADKSTGSSADTGSISISKEDNLSNNNVNISNNSGGDGGFSFFGSMGVDKGVTTSSSASSSFVDISGSSDMNGSTGSSFFDAGSSTGSGGGSGSGSSFFANTGNEPLYDNMSPAASGAYVEKPAVTGGTMYSGPKTTTAVSSASMGEDSVMKTINALSWALALLPLFLSALALILSKIGIEMSTFISNAFYIAVISTDCYFLSQMGIKVSWGYRLVGFLFPPVYLFKKAKILGQKKTYAIVSLIIFIMYLLLIILLVGAMYMVASFISA